MEVPQPTGFDTAARDRKCMRLESKPRALERDRPSHGQRATPRASASLAITIHDADACALRARHGGNTNCFDTSEQFVVVIVLTLWKLRE